MSTPCVISVDWDFFIYTGILQGPFQGKSAINGTPIDVPGRILFDWGHNESHPPGLQSLLWATRYAAFENYGLSFANMVKLMQSPVEFSKTVYRRFNPSFAAPFFAADSHKMIWPVVRDMAEAHEPLHVVSFDAHSDLGYGTEDDGSVRCDNWLLEGL
jgi:hypothetical protein